MKHSLALTLLIVVLANYVHCDRAPPTRSPVRPPVNNSNVIIPTRPSPTKPSPTRQTMSITARPPPVRPPPVRPPVTTTTVSNGPPTRS